MHLANDPINLIDKRKFRFWYINRTIKRLNESRKEASNTYNIMIRDHLIKDKSFHIGIDEAIQLFITKHQSPYKKNLQ